MFIRSLFVMGAAALIYACVPEGTGSTPLAQPPVAMAILGDDAPLPQGSLTFTALGDHSTWLEGTNDEVHLLLKVKAGEAPQANERSPLNIALVIDRSGSMQSENKLSFAKQAAERVTGSLKLSDRLSVVTYDDGVNVLFPAGQVTDAGGLRSRIQQITSGGSTNLSGGMMEGFAQVRGLRIPNSVQRVLLLSDGLANKGVTGTQELERMVREQFQNSGIAISTFGVGSDFNEDLMTSLAEHGRGNYYFIGSPDQIPGIFEKELNGLLSVVAHNTVIRVPLPEGLYVTTVHGAPHTVEGRELVIDLHDLYSNEEKLLLVSLSRGPSFHGPIQLQASLKYDDVLEHNKVKSDVAITTWSPTNSPSVHTAAVNAEVMRRVATFIANDRLEEAQRAVDVGDFKKAQYLGLCNTTYMDSMRVLYEDDAQMTYQWSLNNGYVGSLSEMEKMEEGDLKSLQKEKKAENYSIRKNK